MPRAASSKVNDQFSGDRTTQRRRGRKLLRLWVPDPQAPGFAAEAERQAHLINHAVDAQEVQEVLAASVESLRLDLYDWGPDGPPG